MSKKNKSEPYTSEWIKENAAWGWAASKDINSEADSSEDMRQVDKSVARYMETTPDRLQEIAKYIDFLDEINNQAPQRSI